jgi:hypothetical protein
MCICGSFAGNFGCTSLSMLVRAPAGSAILPYAIGFPDLTWNNFLIGNLLPVTIGNTIGGSIMVAAVYWFIYLRKKAPLTMASRRVPQPSCCL